MFPRDIKIDTFRTLLHGKMAVCRFSTRGEGGRRFLSERGEATGPEKSIHRMSWLNSLSWKGWEGCGTGQDGENKVPWRNSAEGNSGVWSTQCHTGSKCERKPEGKGEKKNKLEVVRSPDTVYKANT